MAEPILVGGGEVESFLLPKFGNRHGLIAGATGTGKTVTLQRLAEEFSRRGTAVFLSDVKGDLSGMCAPGGGKAAFEDRAKLLKIEPYRHEGFPVQFWDVLGEQGHPVRATISEMGPLILSRLLMLNETQEGVLNITFKVADDHGLLLLDLKDLRAMLTYVAENAKALTTDYGNVSAQSVGAIQRQLLTLEQQGAEKFFGEPALKVADLMTQAVDGRGMINILASDKLFQSPRVYATFLLWLLNELFTELPEVGDLEQPKLVFFFDEAHLLFDDAPKALVDKIEQVVRLIRSKGVGVYFVTQNPVDIPDTVLGQLGNRVQHALRAFSPKDQKAVKSAADTFRPNPNFQVAEVITQLSVGEALVSCLDEKGTPNVVQRSLIGPPASRVGPCTPEERAMVNQISPVAGKYEQMIDRESAYELLTAKRQQGEALAEAERQAKYDYGKPARQPAARRSDTPFEAMAKSTLRSVGSQLGRELVRGVLGGLFRGR
jgi:hypothetical protein